MKTRVLVLWADDKSANLGVRVLADGTAAIAKRVWGDESEVTLQDFRGLSSGVRITPRRLAMAYLFRAGPLVPFLQSFDVVIDTGAGDSFADIYGLKRLGAIVGMQRLARRLHIPLILGPQTIGPFKTRLGTRIGSKSLKSASLVFARDSVSFVHARELGCTSVKAATDVVFALETAPAHSTRSHDILFNVSGLLWEKNPHVSSEKYRAAVVSLIDELVRRGRKVTLLAHVLDSNYADNDVPTARSLHGKYDGAVDLLIPKSLEEARQAIATSEVVIASRMHAALNAVSQLVPALPWAYSRKFAPLLEDIGINWSIDLRELQVEEIVAETLRLLDQVREPESIIQLQATEAAARASLRAMESSIREMKLTRTRSPHGH